MITLAVIFFIGAFIGFILLAIAACGKRAEKFTPFPGWTNSQAESHPPLLQAKTEKLWS